MIKQLLIFLFFFSVSTEVVLAEKTIGKGKHKHLGKVSEFDSCSIAEQRAKKEAIKNSPEAGEKVSSEIYSNCSEVDGELECERNQFAIFSLNVIIHNWNKTKEIYDRKPVGKVSSCEIEGEGIVKPIITRIGLFEWTYFIPSAKPTKNDSVLTFPVDLFFIINEKIKLKA